MVFVCFAAAAVTAANAPVVVVPPVTFFHNGVTCGQQNGGVLCAGRKFLPEQPKHNRLFYLLPIRTKRERPSIFFGSAGVHAGNLFTFGHVQCFGGLKGGFDTGEQDAFISHGTGMKVAEDLVRGVMKVCNRVYMTVSFIIYSRKRPL